MIRLKKKSAAVNATWFFFLTLMFLFAGLLVLDVYRYSIAARRAFNYAQAAAQSVASSLTFTDGLLGQKDINNPVFLTQERVNTLCQNAHQWITESVARSSWEYPFYYTNQSPVYVRCGITENNVFEVIVVIRFEPLYSPFFPDLDAFGYSRVRLQRGIENPF